MNADAVAKHYSLLTAEERFRLIVAAGARGDRTEADRLVNSGGTVTLSLPEHVPFAWAFDELATLTFIELVEDAAFYDYALVRTDHASDIFSADAADEDESDEAEDESDAKPDTEPATGETRKRPHWQRLLDVGKAAGFVLRTKAEGWKLFCERLGVPPFVLWKLCPGHDRLQRALAQAETTAFTPKGFVRWLNAFRPAGNPELSEPPLTVEGLAEATEE
jgi:hypothetical protein